MIDELVSRLLANASTPKTIEGAFNAEVLDMSVDADLLPAVYLYVGEDSTVGDEFDACADVMISENLHVIYACAPAQLEALKMEIRGLVMGYTPSGKESALNFLSGTVLSEGVLGELVLWRDVFVTSYMQNVTEV